MRILSYLKVHIQEPNFFKEVLAYKADIQAIKVKIKTKTGILLNYILGKYLQEVVLF